MRIIKNIVSGIVVGLLVASCMTSTPAELKGVWSFTPTSDLDIDKKGESVLILDEKLFGLDDNWSPGKTNAPPISGAWVSTNGVLVLHVTHTECCKVREGTKLKLRVQTLTPGLLRVIDLDTKVEMVLKKRPQPTSPGDVACLTMCDLTKTDALPLQQVPFVEYWSELHGEWLDERISGGMNIDFPTYWFDKSARILTDYGRHGIETNSPWVLLLGSGQSNHGDAGGGAASGLDAIYSLPCTTNGVSLIRSQTNGTVTLRCWGELHTLDPGDVVRHETTWIRTNVVRGESFRIRLTEKERIENFGLIDRNHVKRGR